MDLGETVGKILIFCNVPQQVETRMYKPTSAAEVAYILRKVEKAKAAYLMEMAKAMKTGKSKGKSGDRSSSQGGGEAQARNGLPGMTLPELILPG